MRKVSTCHIERKRPRREVTIMAVFGEKLGGEGYKKDKPAWSFQSL
jgi:hypothetical protein